MTSATNLADATLFDAPSDVAPCELTVVMPVYNEQDALPSCVRSWLATLDELRIDHRMLIIDDGSRDGTAAALDSLGAEERVLAVSKQNEGHGPTILRGYRFAGQTSEWVFQVDSDDEIPASAFPEVWAARHGQAAVFGIRTGREQSLGRKVISRVAALTTRLALKGRTSDPNVPFRLLRADALMSVVAALPDDTFAPNLVIAGVLGRDRSAFAEVPVPHNERRTGEVSIAGLGAFKAAARSFRQTVGLARQLR